MFLITSKLKNMRLQILFQRKGEKDWILTFLKKSISVKKKES